MKRGRDDMNGEPHKRPASGIARSVVAPQGQQRLTTSDALSYLQKVKKKFANNKQVYDEFLEIMKEFKAQRIDTEGVIRRVKTLFKGNRELILGFNFFLPKGYEITMPEEEEEKAPARQPVEFDQAISYVNKIKHRFASDDRVYKSFLEVLNMYRKGQKSISQVYDEVAVLFRSHDDLLDEFTYFLPDNGPTGQQAGRFVGRPSAPSAAPREGMAGTKRKGREEEEGRGRPSLAAELRFFESIKNKVRNRDAYQDFLKCLNLYAEEIIQRTELMNLIQDILARYPELQSGFHDFLNTCELLDTDIDPKALRVEMRQQHFASETRKRSSHMTAKDRYQTTPISELDLSECKRIQKSYVRIPADYPVMHCAGRDKLPPSITDLFNDTWVSMTSGTEDYSFKHMRKNQYEENLFRCEDDRFDLEMDIERNLSAIRALQPLAAELGQMSAEQKTSYRLPERALRAFHYHIIARIYGDQGSQVVDVLQKNPAVAVPVVLTRCKQKDQEWQRVKAEMNGLWRRVYEQNYQRSLDHRSFYFKQTDKRHLGVKTMLNELKEAAEKRRGSEQWLRLFSTAVDFQDRLQPDLTFAYPDPSVHMDVWRVIRLAAMRNSSPEQGKKIVALMTSFIEPLFGLPERMQAQLDQEETALSAASAGKAEAAAAVAAEKDTDEEEEGEADGKGEGAGEEEGCDGKEKCVGAAEAGEATPEAGTPADGAMDGGLEELVRIGSSLLEIGGNAGKAAAAAAEEALAAGGAGEERDVENQLPNSQRNAQCRPLACRCGADEVKAAEGGSDGSDQRIVAYCNETLYVFMRLHHILYDRLRVARVCIEQKVNAPYKQMAAFPHTASAQPASATEEGETAAGDLEKGEEKGKMHTQFMELTRRLLTHDIDITAFEDACRSLLGTNSYVLFTLDKLVQKVIKHMQAMVQEDVTMKVVALKRYEASRASRVQDQVAFANAQVLLGEDSCIRVAWEPSSCALTMQLMDQIRSDATAIAMDPQFAKLLRHFCEEPKELPQAGGGAPLLILQRNLQQTSAQPDSEEMAWLDGCYLRNGLECKISPRAFKEGQVSYVLDTEDVFLRRRRCMDSEAAAEQLEKTAESGRMHRADKFRRWLDVHTQGAPPAHAAAAGGPRYLTQMLRAQ